MILSRSRAFVYLSLFLVILQACSLPVLGAFGTATIVEVNASGSDSLNGGGFDPGATFPTDLAATSGTTAAPVATSASYNFTGSDANAYLFIKSGSNWTPGWYKITSVASNAATLDAAIGHVVLYNGPTALNTVAGCATVASPTTGTWGCDYSRGTAARITFTDLAVGGTNTQFTSTGNPVGPNFVGNFIQVTSGAGFTLQTVEVTSTSGTTATVDKTLGGTSLLGGHGGLGGALASPGFGASLIGNLGGTSSMAIVGSNTYNITGSANVAGGRLNLTSSNFIYGYTTNRYRYNRDANRPILQANANTISLIQVNGGNNNFVGGIDFENGNSSTTVFAYDDGGAWGGDTLWNCKFHGMAVAAKIGPFAQARYCWIDACTGSPSAFQGGNDRVTISDCVFTSNTQLAFSARGGVFNSIFYNNGCTTNEMVSDARVVSGCLFHTCSSSTARFCGSTVFMVENSIFWNMSGSGAIAVQSSGDNSQFINNCAFGSNTLDCNTGPAFSGDKIIGKITLTGDPCAGASGGNFALNNTAGAGALLRSLGFPATTSNALTSNYQDVGPVRHQDPSGGGFIPGPLQLKTPDRIIRKLPLRKKAA